MTKHIIIIGGGVAGLSAGCYALESGYRTTIVEHNLALGGVCTAWQRGPYTVDGCIHWLMEGDFTRLYEELGIMPAVSTRVLETWATYRDARDGFEVAITRDIDAFIAELARESSEDAPELERLRRGVSAFTEFKPPLDAVELASFRETVRGLWEMRGAVPSLVHYRKPIASWADEHLRSPRLRRLFKSLITESAPAFLYLMVFGLLEKGFLSRPVGGTAAFRDALVRSYQERGGETLLHSTVEEVLVESGRARGVRLTDGTLLAADLVISTASTPESVLRLLGGRYDAEPTRERLTHWKFIDPIVLASFGVASPYAEATGLVTIDGIDPLDTGGRTTDYLSLRLCNDDPSFAPPGHSVVQAMLPSSYEWWATRGTRYGAEKDAIGSRVIAALEPHLPDFHASIRIDVATPLTYWQATRSWRGAYEGWIPTAESMFMGHVEKTLDGLQGFYMAGQWVEPGGGVPVAMMSGRQVVQLICRADKRQFMAA